MVSGGFAAILACVAIDCGGESENGACSWLFAPSSFVDAGLTGCVAEPAGQLCDKSTGRCKSICEPNQYLLTCRTEVVSHLATSGNAVPDLDFEPRGSSACNPAEALLEGPRGQVVYCCQCEQ